MIPMQTACTTKGDKLALLGFRLISAFRENRNSELDLVLESVVTL